MANNFLEINEGDKGAENNSANLVASDFLFNRNLLKPAADAMDVTKAGFPSVSLDHNAFSSTKLLSGGPPETPQFHFDKAALAKAP